MHFPPVVVPTLYQASLMTFMSGYRETGTEFFYFEILGADVDSETVLEQLCFPLN